MKKNLANKRLLLLGGSLWKKAIQDFAQEQGIILIATGNNHNAGIFEIADECYDVDSTNTEAMKQLIREKRIDGVYMGGSESVISTACAYLQELGLPCYCTREQWEYLQNKEHFKRLCIEYGLPVVPKYDYELENPKRNIPDSAFPVITKPTDGCGSSGFSVCRNSEELRKGYAIARQASPTGSVIVEKFVKNDGVVVFYTFSNGKMYFSGLEDKYPVKYQKQGSYVGGLFVFESKLTQEFRLHFDEKIAEMFQSIGIREGSVWIEVFHDGENYYFNEVGFRYGGSVSIYPVDYFYQINQVAADIHYALTGESCISEHTSLIRSTLPRKKYYCIYPVHINAGTISSISGLDKIAQLENIVYLATTKYLHDRIESSGSFSQVFALVHFVCNTTEECIQTIDRIHQMLVVFDEHGNNMVNRMLDVGKIIF